MIFGVSPTRDTIAIAQTTGSGETFAITSIKSIRFQVASGDDLKELLEGLIASFARGRRNRRATIALLVSSSGRFKSSVEAIKAEAVVELAAVESEIPVVKVSAASLKKALGCAGGEKWPARATERFNPDGVYENWSQGTAGAVAAALKVAGGTT